MTTLCTDPAALARLAASLASVLGPDAGGIWLRAQAGPERLAWLDGLRNADTATRPWVRVPANVDLERLLGGLDLGATLNAGRPVVQDGLLATADGGFLELRMAERQSVAVTSALAGAMDAGQVALERDGISRTMPSRCCVIACDESLPDDDPMDSRLADRLGLVVTLGPLACEPIVVDAPLAAHRWQSVVADAAAITQLQRIADGVGLHSPRPVLAALRAARAAAALAGRREVSAQDVIDAAAVCLLARVPGVLESLQAAPPAEPEPSEPEPSEPESSEPREAEGRDVDTRTPRTSDERPDEIAAAVQAILPENLLAGLTAATTRSLRRAGAGRSGKRSRARERGRPVGTRPGVPRDGERLHVSATLAAAIPWQRLRGGETGGPVRFRKSDLRLRRLQAQRRTTTIFVVDASGSAAAQRLAETKGAIELLLAECYVRRDQVALVTFRRDGAELLLPATRSLVRAKRSLAALPGGGGTPLASGLQLALATADAAVKRGEVPLVVLLSDARANVALDGAPEPERATAEALAVAKQIAASGHAVLAIDTGRRPSSRARALAQSLGARYVPLPVADARRVTHAVSEAAAQAG